MEIYRRNGGDASPDFGKRTHTQTPPPTDGPNICIIWSLLSCFLKTFLARHACSTAFYKVSVLEIRNLGSITSRSNYIFFCIESIKCPKIVCGCGVLRPCSRLRIGSDAPTQNVLSTGTLPWTRWGSLQHSPRSTVVKGKAARRRWGNRRSTQGRKPTTGKSWLCCC